jgi:hypothetical protein
MTRTLGGALALACALLLPAMAGAATILATPANIPALAKAAQPGDTVQLPGGTYPLGLYNINPPACCVTLAPAPGAVVVISGDLETNGSSNLVIQGLTVAMAPATQYGVTAWDNQNVTYDGLKIHQADNALLSGVGVFVRNGSGVTVKNTELSWLGVGITVLDSSGAQVLGNNLHDINVDGIDLAGADSAKALGNTITNMHPGDGDHPDCIQWWPTAANPNPAHIVISGNRCERGSGGIPQGFFGASGSDVSITGNIALGTMYNGISMSGVTGGVISGNFLQPYPDMGTQIIVRGGTSGVTIDQNAAPTVSNYNPAGEPANTNITIGANAVTTPAVAGDYTQLIAWQKATGGAPAPAPTPTPVPTPVPTVNPLQATVDAQAAQIATLKAKTAKATSALLAYPSNTAKQLQAKIANALAALK